MPKTPVRSGKPKPGGRPGAGTGPKNRWPQREVRFAALWTTHPPAQRCELAADPALSIRTKLDFEPQIHSKLHGIALGLLHTTYLPRTLEFAGLPVKRGRWGTKPAEPLMPLQDLPSGIMAWPAVRLRGALRSLAAALEAVATTPLGAADERAAPALWLAAQLAISGIVTADEFNLVAARHEWKRPKPGPEVALRSGAWVWRGYARDLAGKLEKQLRLPRHANPYRSELSRMQVANLLRRAPDELAAVALEELAAQRKLKLVHPAYPETYALSGRLGPTQPVGGTQPGANLLKRFETGGQNLRALEMEPSQRAELAQLLEAERIVELHQGFAVAVGQLRGWLGKLKPDFEHPPSVRQIKDKLGLGRREAEALRAWLVAQGQQS